MGWIFNNEGFQSAYSRDPTSGVWSSNISFTRPAQEGGDFGSRTAPQFLICPAKGLVYLRDQVWGPILQRVSTIGLHLDHLIAWWALAPETPPPPPTRSHRAASRISIIYLFVHSIVVRGLVYCTHRCVRGGTRPYDWGGCGCKHDWPWGSVGFPRFSSEILNRYPQTGSSPTCPSAPLSCSSHCSDRLVAALQSQDRVGTP